MFSFLKKSPEKKLTAQYNKLLEEAMLHQRKGDIKNYSRLIDQADKMLKKVDELNSKGWLILFDKGQGF